MIKPATLATLAVTAALVLAACGGDDSGGSEDYGTDLNNACNELQANLAKVSVEAKEQGTSAANVSNEYVAEFRDQIGALEPPADLEDDATALLDKIDSLPEGGLPTDEATAYYKELASLYTDVGADDCAAQQTIVIKTLQQVGNGGLFETG